MNKLLTTPPKKNADPGDKKTDRHSFLAILFSIFVALVLWFYVQDAEAPDYTKTFTSIPVKIQSLSSSFSVLEGGGTAVDVTLIGKRSTLNKIKVSDLEAYLDLTNVNQSGHYEPEVSVMLPEGTELFDCFPKKASLFIDETVSAEVEVSVELGSYRVPENTGIEAKSLVDVISVKGPKTILSRIEKAKVVTGDLGDVSSSFEKNLEYQFYDDKGNVVESRHIVVPEQNVKVQFSVFKTRVVPLTVLSAHGWWKTDDMRYTIEPKTVMVKGEPERVDALTGIPALILDETTLDSNRYSGTILPSQLHLPEGISLAETVGDVDVELTLTDNSAAVMKLDLLANPARVSVEYPQGGLSFAYQDPNFQFRIRGSKEALSSAVVDDFFVTIDLSEISVPGVYQVPVQIGQITASEGKYYPVGSYNISIVVS